MKADIVRFLICSLFVGMLLGTAGCKRQAGERGSAVEGHDENNEGESRAQLPMDLSKWELVGFDPNTPKFLLWPLEPSNLLLPEKYLYGIDMYSAMVETSEPYNGYLLEVEFDEALDTIRGEGIDFSGAKLCLPQAPYQLAVVKEPKGLCWGKYRQAWWYEGSKKQRGLLFFEPLADSVTEVVLKIPYKQGENRKTFTFTFKSGIGGRDQ